MLDFFLFQLHMQYGKWLTGRICFVPPSHLKSHVVVEVECFCVLFVYIYFSDAFLLSGKVDKLLAQSCALLLGVYKKHLNGFIA